MSALDDLVSWLRKETKSPTEIRIYLDPEDSHGEDGEPGVVSVSIRHPDDEVGRRAGEWWWQLNLSCSGPAERVDEAVERVHALTADVYAKVRAEARQR